MKRVVKIFVTLTFFVMGTNARAQEVYDGSGINVYKIEKVGERLTIGDESTKSIFMPDVEEIHEEVFLTTPNLESIEIGLKHRKDKIYIYYFGELFFHFGGRNLADDLKLEKIQNLKEFVMYQPGWCEYPFSTFWKYPSQLTFVPYGLGSGCNNLERVILPEAAQCIQNSFNECPKLETIAIPASTGFIGKSFNHCASLHEIRVHTGYVPQISDSFTGLAEDAVIYVPRGFKEVYDCSPWSELGYPIVEDVDYDCGYTPAQLPFRGCEMLDGSLVDNASGIVLSEGKRFGNELYHFEDFDADGDPVFFNDAREEVEGGYLEYYRDGAGSPEVDIADYVLCGSCAYLAVPYLRLSDTIERIGAFTGAYNECIIISAKGYGYHGLFNEGLKIIGRKAFSHSEIIGNEITLPSTLEYIGDAAFDASDLKRVRCAAMTPPMCGDERVFGDKSNLTLMVAPGAKDAYAAAPVWSSFGTIIEDTSLLSVNAVTADSIEGEAEYYTIDGRRVQPEALTHGLYIVRKGATVTKVII